MTNSIDLTAATATATATERLRVKEPYIQETIVTSSGDTVLVSTVRTPWWDYMGGGLETLVFAGGVGGGSIDSNSEPYDSESEALVGHRKMCEKWAK